MPRITYEICPVCGKRGWRIIGTGAFMYKCRYCLSWQWATATGAYEEPIYHGPKAPRSSP